MLRIVRECITKLPEQEQNVISFRYGIFTNELDLDQIAGELKIEKKEVSKILNRAKRKLKKILEEYGIGNYGFKPD